MTTLLNKPESGPPTHRPIRFVNSQGQPPLKRRRINAACLTCRRRKTRCAGERPICSTCTKNNHHCQGYLDEARKDADAIKQQPDLDDAPLLEDVAVLPAAADEDDDEKMVVLKPESGPASDAAPLRPPPPPAPPTNRAVPALAEPDEPDDDDVGISTGKTSSSPQPPPPIPAPPPPPPSRHRIDDMSTSPTFRRNHNHRIPYFRYFGPTAIVPGFKQMVVSVRDRRRSIGGSQAGTSPLSTPGGPRGSSCAVGNDVVVEDLPSYDPTSPLPVSPIIIGLVKTFFFHLGCNYPFLKETKFVRLVREKRVEPILVDAVCGLAARFADAHHLPAGSDKLPRTERGHAFASRAKHATVDTFPCPSVGAVQACLLMAYEGFGANQDSALWMYLGLAIRMAIDLGLQKRVGIQYQGEKDPWYTRHRSRVNGETQSPEEKKHDDDAPTLTPEEQKEVEQERIDTFWAVFILDRVISSGTGRPVTFRDDDFDLPLPEPTSDPTSGWPLLFPTFLEIIHLYGRVSDVLNKIHQADDLNQEKWSRLSGMENQLTKLYKSWDLRLQFNVSNFKAYLRCGQGTTFILLHFWFHALFIILHQPTLMTPFGEIRSELQLLPDSRELSMSSAKTICDILAFADLMDPKSFIGNPFTSQPIYIAACAFLMESSANASAGPSREGSPPGAKDRLKAVGAGSSTGGEATALAAARSKHSRHSLLASAANQNYQRCYNSLQQLHTHWGGVKYILTALDQKSKGIWDCETYTSEEYESTKAPATARPGMSGELSHPSPKTGGGPPPIAWSLAGTANSPSSNLTLMYQNWNGSILSPAQQQQQQQHHQQQQSMHAVAGTPPGNMVYDPIRQSLPPDAMYPPAIPQANTSAARHSPRFAKPRRTSTLPGRPHAVPGFDSLSDDGEAPKMFAAPGQTPASHHSAAGGFDAYGTSPVGKMADTARGVVGAQGGVPQNAYYVQGLPYQAPWGLGMGNMDAITFDSQDIDIGALGLQQPELMSRWLEYIPSDVLGLFDNHDMSQAATQGGPRP
ncbi:hypothetical protein XA68_14966 [Ophiocordyceps unilateralis]|uniref:Zn(2)-C6 fungal-type domain-containing protein n=1 Tax=Ophiocordyceps unilateralis TaxID=268505 RepID=A0A2A9PMK3_OPHUN|nr:hypothetical protein XA68_14966 [Ophiocordyceps unilateralis]